MAATEVFFRRFLLEDGEVEDEVPEVKGEEEKEPFAALAILTLMILLGLALTIGHLLEWKKIWWIPEAAAAMLLGVLMGWVAKTTGKDETFQDWLSFKGYFFYFALLPPIIFEAGYSLNVKPFLQNAGAICAYAFIGTAMSTILIGFTMWAAGAMGLCFAFTFLESLIFGAVISATDPVSVLSVFQRLQAHPDLYTLVFGESIFNDAVAIVLFRSLLTFLKKDVTFKLVMFGMLTFVEIFVCSMLIGIAYGFIASLAFKTDVFRNKHSPVEASLVVLLALCSFFTAESLGQSGIVAILFCGMMMAKYTRPNLSRTAENRSVGFFKILAYMSETFVFIYIGTTLFIHKEAWNEGMTWAFLVVALFAMAHSRFFNVYANSKLVNSLRPEEMHVPKTHQFMLWFSGLRGAIAFALAIRASSEIFIGDKAPVGRVFLTSVFFIVLITVVVNGGATTWLLERFDLRCSEPAYSTLLERIETAGSPSRSGSPNSANGSSGGGILGKIREMNRTGISSRLQDIDDRFLSRFFIPDGMELVQTASGEGDHPMSEVLPAGRTPRSPPMTENSNTEGSSQSNHTPNPQP